MVGSFTASAIAAGSAWPDSGLAQNTICEEGWRKETLACNRPWAAVAHVSCPVAGIELVGKGHRDVVGARLTLEGEGTTLSKFILGGGSYLSAHDPRDVLGIGTAAAIDWLEIKWPQPSGKVERLTNVPLDGYVTIVEGRRIVQRFQRFAAAMDSASGA